MKSFKYKRQENLFVKSNSNQMSLNFKKYISCLALCLFILGTSYAQRFSAGAVLGINASQIDGDAYAGFHKIGIVGGLQAFVAIKEKLDVGIELRYNQLGSRSVPNNQNSINPFNATFNYAEIPVTINYKDWYIEDENYYRIHFHAGLAYGRLISTKLDSEDSFDQLKDYFNDNYFGALAGVTYFFNKKIGITARFNRGILLLFNNNKTDAVNHPSLLSKHITFTGTYKF